MFAYFFGRWSFEFRERKRSLCIVVFFLCFKEVLKILDRFGLFYLFLWFFFRL